MLFKTRYNNTKYFIVGNFEELQILFRYNLPMNLFNDFQTVISKKKLAMH